MHGNIGWRSNFNSNLPSHKEHVWKPWQIGEHVSLNAVEGGRDIDHSTIYVGRASYKGDLLPAKVIPSKSAIYVSYNGEEINLHSCELMMKEFGFFEWVRSSNGRVPEKAVPVGNTLDGETLYAGRAQHAGGLIVGKVHPSHGSCYIPFGGKEHVYKSYEVLCNRF